MTLRMLMNRALDADLTTTFGRLSDAANLWAAVILAGLAVLGLAAAGWTIWSNRRARRLRPWSGRGQGER